MVSLLYEHPSRGKTKWQQITWLKCRRYYIYIKHKWNISDGKHFPGKWVIAVSLKIFRIYILFREVSLRCVPYWLDWQLFHAFFVPGSLDNFHAERFRINFISAHIRNALWAKINVSFSLVVIIKIALLNKWLMRGHKWWIMTIKSLVCLTGCRKWAVFLNQCVIITTHYKSSLNFHCIICHMMQ